MPWKVKIREHFSFIIKISHLTLTNLHLLFSLSDNSKLCPATSENLNITKYHSIFSYTVDTNLIADAGSTQVHFTQEHVHFEVAVLHTVVLLNSMFYLNLSKITIKLE